MKELFETVMNRLTDQVPALKYIDFDMGQLDLLALDQKPPLLWPCALLDIAYPKCEDETEEQQHVTARIGVKLAFEVPIPTDSLATASRRAAALSIFTTVDNVHKALQGYDSAEFGAFSRLSLSPDNRYAGIKIINVTYETQFEDLTAVS